MAGGKTRIIHLDGGQERERGVNFQTEYAIFDAPRPGPSFRELFVHHYARIRQRCADIGQPGLVMVATRGRHLAGMLWLAAKVHTANAAIIGRHNISDLYLDGDDSLSLRHLAVILSPLAARADELRFRVVDLRTRSAFQDEQGRSFEALAAEGPVFLRCGDYALLCLITGDPTSWPASAEDAWACIPERVYLEANEAEPDRWQRMRRWMWRWSAPGKARAHGTRIAGPVVHRSAAITQVQPLAGPARAHASHLAEGEDVLGTLRLRTRGEVRHLRVGRAALQRGILLGRYDRCDMGGHHMLTSDRLSRVHLLVTDVGGRVYAIDTASTNGTQVHGHSSRYDLRILPLERDLELNLGRGAVLLRWCPS